MEEGHDLQRQANLFENLTLQNVSSSAVINNLFPIDKITYLTKDQFLTLLEPFLQHDTFIEFSEYFQRQYSSFRKINGQKVIRFPIVKDQDRDLLQKKLNLFAIQYSRQYKQDEDNFEDYCKKYQRQDFRMNVNYYDVEITDPTLIKVPKFLSNKEKSFNTLLGYDTMMNFITQLNQVKQLISNQLREQDSEALIFKYSTFLNEFLLYKSIKDDDWLEQTEKQSRQDIKSRITQFLDDNTYTIQKDYGQKPFIVIWKTIFQKLIKKQSLTIKKQKQLQALVTKCRQILLKALSEVYLYSNNNKQIYGANVDGSILINTNQQGSLSFQQFKSGPFKPYLYLTLVHQMTHYLIRNFDDCQVQRYNNSFQSKDSIGSKVMTNISIAYGNQFKYFQLKKQSRISLKDIQDKCIVLDQDLSTIKQTFNQFESLFNRNIDDFLLVKKILLIMQKVIKPLKRIKSKICQQFGQQQVNSIYQYIDLLVVNNQTNCREEYGQQQQSYRFFFSIFSKQDIALKIFQPLVQNRQRYHYYRQKLISIQENRYFICKNKTIESIIKEFFLSQQLRECFDLKLDEDYSYLTLIQKMSDEDLYQKIIDFNNVLKKQMDYNAMKICYQNWKSFISEDIFDSFDEKSYTELKVKTRIVYFREILPKSIKNFLKDEQLSKSIGKFCQLQFSFDVMKQFFKNYQLFKAVYQLPQFFTLTQIQKFQSGRLIQIMLFPSLDNYIYKKDYQYLEDITNYQGRKKVGQKPYSQYDQRLSCMVGLRQCKNKSNLSVDITHRICGTQWITRKHKKEGPKRQNSKI